MDSPYEELRSRIVSGDLPPGVHLVETALADMLGISRTPIREALTRLAQDGLVERGSRGLHVRHRSPSEILEIYEVRIALERTAARIAAERHQEYDRIAIQGHLTRLEQEQQSDPAVLAAVNRDFHRSIWTASHNHTLIDVLDRLAVHLFRYPFTTYEAPGRAESSLTEHRELAEAILARDSDRAAHLAEEHMITARTIRLEMWASGVEV